jgi:hypothetical protein
VAGFHVKLPCVTTARDRTGELRATMRSERLRTPLGIDDCDLRTIEHPLYGRVWAPQRIVHLSALLALFGWALRGGGWRGQGDIDWHLDSTAVRRIGRESATCLEQRVREYELALLEQARLAGHGRVNGRDLHDLELLALLRHHGAATRLMDFTRNVWVALWFACRDVHRGFGLLVGLDLAGSFEVRDQATLAMPFPQLVHKAADRLSTWRPSALSPRMPAQHGCTAGVPLARISSVFASRARRWRWSLRPVVRFLALRVSRSRRNSSMSLASTGGVCLATRSRPCFPISMASRKLTLRPRRWLLFLTMTLRSQAKSQVPVWRRRHDRRGGRRPLDS